MRTVHQARRVGFRCHECNRFFDVEVPWDATAADRSALMTTATSYHRGVCTTADADLPPEGRIYTIQYPRS